jgi:hypothetical protein
MIRKLLYIVKTFIKKLLKPLYYSYPGYMVYDFINRLTVYKRERQRICKAIGYYPNLKNPQSFNEKILWKKVYDRNPILPVSADKYMVRQYLKEVLGKKEAEKILVPLSYVTNKPETIPFDNLSEEYVIKPNHASGMIILAEDIEGERRYSVIDGQKTTILSNCAQARDEIINVCKSWLSMAYSFHFHEWAYQRIKRRILIEKLLRGNNGKIPEEYKFRVFHGKCHYITVWYDRFIDLRRGLYTPEWEQIDVKTSTRQADYKKKPENLKYMIELSELLGKPFDFVRVDLFSVNNQTYFGELTNYPASGSIPFKPVSFDFELGSKWKIIPNYWKQ